MSTTPPFPYQVDGEYFAQTSRGLEEPAAEELLRLGAASATAAFCGVRFRAAPDALYRVNYAARLITRVLAPLAVFHAHTPDYFYRRAHDLPWETLLSVDGRFAVQSNVSDSRIRHAHYTALKLKDAVVDRFREQFGRRPDVDTENPDLWLNVHIHRDEVTIHADTSGGSLHKRGYRQATVEAPMQETVAAAMLALSGWDGTIPLHDPMCGSGTLLCEAFMLAARLPAGFRRERFGFARLPDFAEAAWKRVRAEVDAAVQPVKAGLITGSDIDPSAVTAARRNVESLPGGRAVHVAAGAIADWPGLKGGMIVCNPPYGIRLGDREGAAALLKSFGDVLKQRCTGSKAVIYYGDPTLLKSLGLKPKWKRPVTAGGLEGIMAAYEFY